MVRLTLFEVRLALKVANPLSHCHLQQRWPDLPDRSHLKEGAGVVTSRGDVHYVVTEFGLAYLHGKSLGERAEALIKIAHPDFRDEQERFAVNRNLMQKVR